MTQAERIAAKFGGVRRLAAAMNKDDSTVYRWTYPRSRGGTGGLIPAHCVPAVRAAAFDAGIELTAEDWLP